MGRVIGIDLGTTNSCVAVLEGGEATVHEGSRLFFPGGLVYEGQHGEAQAFAAVWRGGKASRLYAALGAHWKTKKTERSCC